MAMNDDCQVEYHFMTEQKFKIEDNDYQFEVDSFDFAAADAGGGGPRGEGMDEWEFAKGGSVGAGQVTEILERQANADDFIIIDIIDDLRLADDGGFVFGQTMYFE